MAYYRTLLIRLIIILVPVGITYGVLFGASSTQPQPPFIVDTMADINGSWPTGSFVYVKKTSSTFIIDGSTFQVVSPGNKFFVKKDVQHFQLTTTPANVTTASFTVLSGSTYYFQFNVVFQSSATGTGIILRLNHPGASVFTAKADIPVAADATAGSLQGWLTSPVDTVTGTGVQAVNTDYLATINGIIVSSKTGTLQLMAAPEVNTSSVSVRPFTYGFLNMFPF